MTKNNPVKKRAVLQQTNLYTLFTSFNLNEEIHFIASVQQCFLLFLHKTT